MDLSRPRTSSSDRETRALNALLDAFSCAFSLDDIADAYARAKGDVNKAGDFLTELQLSMPQISDVERSTKTNISKSDKAVEENYSGNSSQPRTLLQIKKAVEENHAENSDQTRMPEKLQKSSASFCSVSSVLGKESAQATTVTKATQKEKTLKLALPEYMRDDCTVKSDDSDAAPKRETLNNKDVEEFLFHMLGEGYNLNMEVIRQVLGSCGYDIKRSMEALMSFYEKDLDKKSENKCKATQRMEFLDPDDPDLIYGQEFCFPTTAIYYPSYYDLTGIDGSTMMHEHHTNLEHNYEGFHYLDHQVDSTSWMHYPGPNYDIPCHPFSHQPCNNYAANGRLVGAEGNDGVLHTSYYDTSPWTAQPALYTSGLFFQDEIVQPKVNPSQHNHVLDFGSKKYKMSAEKVKTCNKDNKNTDRRLGSVRKNVGQRKRTLPPKIIVKSYTSQLNIGDPEGRIIINTDDYNGNGFQAFYPIAKFFVTKPIDKADIHKSIKYGVWSACCSGSRKLDSAFKEAQAIASNSSSICPIFLLFSVNGDSNFNGVAEMIGAVDFQKDMDFWCNDRYFGYFPVKWHIIKDVPNSYLQGLLLPNKKSVTSSKDIEEITYDCGISMLNIFKYTRAERCILQDFMIHEEEEPKKMNEKRFKLRRGAQHFVRSRCAVPSNNLMMYQVVKKTENLTDEMCHLNLTTDES